MAYHLNYRQVSNIRRTLEDNYIVDGSDVVGALPVGATPNYIFILHLTPGFYILCKDNRKPRWESLSFGIWCLISEILQ